MIKNNKGITLISLIVTVMLLIILIGVGLNTTFISIKDVTDNKLNTELGLVRQAIVERYSMAMAVNKVKSVSEDSFWIGDKIENKDLISLPEKANDFTQRLQNYHPKYQEDYYYRITPEQLEEIGVSNAEHTYIINYKTGEVYNETKQVDSQKNLLYLSPANYNSEDTKREDTESFNDWENT